MTFSNLFRTTCFAALGTFILSCDRSDPNIDHPQSVKVLSVEASTNFDLSARSDWNFSVHGCDYSFVIDGSKLIATPSKASETFAFSITVTDKRGYAVLTFSSPHYFKSRAEAIIPNIQNQSTPEKFMLCDVLRAEYNAEAMQDISITLFHENSLLDFEAVDLPADAQVYIKQVHNQTIHPLKYSVEPVKYRALVLPQNYEPDVYVVVETGGKKYKTQLRDRPTTRQSMPHFEGIGQSAVVKFKVRINDEDELVIEDYDIKHLVKEWPITQ